MKAPQSKQTALTFEQANTMCLGFIPAAEPLYDYIANLEENGFAAFRPSWDFRSSFCGCPDDVERLRRVDLERAKLWLAHPYPFPTTAEQRQLLHVSPLIAELSQARDEANGAPLTEIATRYPGEIWRMEIEPCGYRAALSSIKEHGNYARRRDESNEKSRARLAHEARTQTSGLSGTFAFDERGRFAFFTTIMQGEVEPQGFDFDEEKSSVDYPVFSKKINDDWDLSWSLEEKRQFLWDQSSGVCELFLALRNKSIGRERLYKAKTGQVLQIRFAHTIVGFKGAYWKFEDLDQLELIVKAHMQLYREMSSTIEGSARHVLGAT